MESALASRRSPARLLVPVAVGAAVAVGLGVYGREHQPTGRQIEHLFFTGTINLKVWLASAVLTLALVQVLTALWLYGRLPGVRRVPRRLGLVHRTSGVLAFVFAVPVAYACLWSLGFQHSDTRVLVHSIAGCFFFGAFAAKVVVVRSRSLPGAALPVAGGLLFSALVVVWLTSVLWFFEHHPFPSF
jgi:hypothetical protein